MLPPRTPRPVKTSCKSIYMKYDGLKGMGLRTNERNGLKFGYKLNGRSDMEVLDGSGGDVVNKTVN